MIVFGLVICSFEVGVLDLMGSDRIRSSVLGYVRICSVVCMAW